MSGSYDYYVGLDVSRKMTSVCVIDVAGTKQCEGKCNSRPQDIGGWLSNRVAAGKTLRIGLEAGSG
ncbi:MULTISPECIES: hypothetical protein [Mesorhizobium]|uniref:hypothetical protein n=1 Tax=Mesorhizobium TaxID=68287 RepID=UPI0018F65CB1|nr:MULTISPECIES: hypothetical protein [Mesorhizobium]